MNPTRAQFDSHVVNPAIVYTKRDVARLLAKIDVRDVSESVRPDLGPSRAGTKMSRLQE